MIFHKKITIVFIMSLVVAFICTIAIALICIFHFSDVDKQFLKFDKPPLQKTVIYIPGWKNICTHQNVQLENLRKIFSQSQLIIEEWNATGDFESCLKKSDFAAFRLSEKIARFPESQRENTIVVGHSLGGRIVIRTLALLQKRGVSIERGIFLAAAIPDDDPDILLAISGTREPNLNLYNRHDFILRHVYGTMGEGLKNAMGAYGYGMPYRKTFLYEYNIESEPCPILSLNDYLGQFENHDALKYLDGLKKLLASQDAAFRYPHTEILFSSFGTWLKQDSKDNWCLEKHNFTSKMRIVTPEKKIRASGSSKEITAIWENDIDIQISNSNSFIRNIRVLQDLPNPPLKIIDIGFVWDTIKEYQKWRLQKKDMLYRIVDPKDYQRACGRMDIMKDSFENIVKQINHTKKDKHDIQHKR